MMLAAVRQAEWDMALVPGETIVTDPTRMAHGILTGIGFLCAGVIFREGFSVQGLTTASSLWLTSALGLLFGVGMHGLAITGTIVTLIVLTGFRLLYRFLPRRIAAELTVRLDRGADHSDARVIRALEQNGMGALQIGLSAKDDATSELHLKITKTGALTLADIARVLDDLPSVRGYQLQLHEETQ
jgi:putative Mg2+ transporter-C (MgtC) family protein